LKLSREIKGFRLLWQLLDEQVSPLGLTNRIIHRISNRLVSRELEAQYAIETNKRRFVNVGTPVYLDGSMFECRTVLN
jgi:hypothetical protein